MTLEKKPIPVSFEGTLDTKTDPKHVVPGSFTLVQNAVRSKGKIFSKRSGSKLLSAGSNHTAQGIVEHKGQLIKFEDELLKVYSESTSSWVTRGRLTPCVARAEGRQRGQMSFFDVDSATNGNYTVTAYTHSYGSGVYYSVYDETSKVTLASGIYINAYPNGTSPRCMALGSKIFIFMVISTGDLIRHEIDISAPLTLSSGTVVGDGLDYVTYSPSYDIQPFPGSTTEYAMLYGRTDTTMRLRKFNTSGTMLATQTISTQRSFTSCTLVITATKIIALWFRYYGAGNNVLLRQIFDYSLTSVVGVATVDTVPDPFTYDSVTGLPNEAGTEIRIFYGGTSLNVVKTTTIDVATGNIGTISPILYRARLRSRAFKRVRGSTEDYYVCIENLSFIQPTYFIVRHDGYTAARFKSQLARGLETDFYSVASVSLARVHTETADRFSFATVFRERVFFQSGALSYTSNLGRATINFAPEPAFSTVQVGSNLVIAGGKVAIYDGLLAAEAGFHLFPEHYTMAEIATGNLDKTKTYQWRLVYEWADANGTIHRSAPSNPFTWSATASTYQVDITPLLLPLTDKPGVACVLYRTEAGKSTFYRVSPMKLAWNSPEVLGTAIRDNVPDTSLIQGEVLYDTGGVLENIPPPNACHVQVFNSRVVVSDTEDGDVWYSKTIAERKAIQFSDFLRLEAPNGAKIKATGVLDEKLILLQGNGNPYATFGTGPDDLGSGSFATPVKIEIDGSLKDAPSIVSIPNEGLALKTPQGIYQITRDLQSVYFGADVENWNNTTITGSEVDEKNSLVYFLTKEGPTLVYDYSWQQWYVFTFSGVGCTLYSGNVTSNKKVLCYIKPNGDINISDETLFKDAGAHYFIKVVTGWLGLTGLSGFQRLYRLAFNGKKLADHTLKIGMAFDYEDTDTSRAAFTAGADQANGTYRIQTHLARQKCEAIRLSFEDECETTLITQDSWATSISLPAPNPTRAVGQLFKAPAAYSVCRVKLRMQVEAAATGNLQLKIFNTIGNTFPTGAALGTSDPVAAASVTTPVGPTAQDVVFTFPTPVALVAGGVYAFALFGDFASGTLAIMTANSSVYADGHGVTTLDGVAWTLNANDLSFGVDFVVSPTGKTLEMDSLALVVGAKRGLAKLPAGQRVLTT